VLAAADGKRARRQEEKYSELGNLNLLKRYTVLPAANSTNERKGSVEASVWQLLTAGSVRQHSAEYFYRKSRIVTEYVAQFTSTEKRRLPDHAPKRFASPC
jgi:hypothetical protein